MADNQKKIVKARNERGGKWDPVKIYVVFEGEEDEKYLPANTFGIWMLLICEVNFRKKRRYGNIALSLFSLFKHLL